MNKVADKQNSFYYQWGTNCDCWNLVDAPSLSVKLETMPPGGSEQLHFHQHAQQFFFILKGAATLYVDGEKIIVTEQQGLLVLPEQKHIIVNETELPVDFLVISQPSANDDRVTIS